VYSYTAERDAIFEYDPWYLVGSDRELRVFVCAGERRGPALIAQFDGMETRDQVAPLVGLSICVDADQLPRLREGEYYWDQLVGLRVVTEEGRYLGTVERLFETGANDVMVVAGERERLIPYVPQTIRAVDLPGQTVTVDWDPDF